MKLKKTIFIFIFILIQIEIGSAVCHEGQIDINTADKSELDSLYGIGLVKSESIINSRPFESIEELIKVNGIGEITLQRIKEQGLACIGEEKLEETKKDELSKEQVPADLEQDNKINEKYEPIIEIEDSKPQNTKLEIIKLNPQTIKIENGKENLNKTNYSIYGLVVFCILLGFLFIRNKNRYNKNEFKQ